jgi:pentatricopeptide repeat protein
MQGQENPITEEQMLQYMLRKSSLGGLSVKIYRIRCDVGVWPPAIYSGTRHISNPYIKFDSKPLNPYVLMYGLCRNYRVLEAVEVKNGMVEGGVKADEVTYRTLVCGFSRTEALEMAMKMTADMLSLGFVPSEASCSFML